MCATALLCPGFPERKKNAVPDYLFRNVENLKRV